ncbi:MAG TPA: hypothetical protein VJV79_31595, partial [Polyangiaceae bacterium]|nr:hypothetical protein [Polyangiaceae bacterium]
APQKRELVDCPATVAVCGPAPNSPALDEVMSAYERQSRLLDAAFSSVGRFGELQLAVRSELLEALDEVCMVRAGFGMGLPSVNRC